MGSEGFDNEIAEETTKYNQKRLTQKKKELSDGTNPRAWSLNDEEKCRGLGEEKYDVGETRRRRRRRRIRRRE